MLGSNLCTENLHIIWFFLLGHLYIDRIYMVNFINWWLMQWFYAIVITWYWIKLCAWTCGKNFYIFLCFPIDLVIWVSKKFTLSFLCVYYLHIALLAVSDYFILWLYFNITVYCRLQNTRQIFRGFWHLKLKLRNWRSVMLLYWRRKRYANGFQW